MDEYDKKLEELKDSVQEIKIDVNSIKKDLEHNDEKTDKVENSLGRIAWLMVLSVVGAVMSFLIDGGFNGGR